MMKEKLIRTINDILELRLITGETVYINKSDLNKLNIEKIKLRENTSYDVMEDFKDPLINNGNVFQKEVVGYLITDPSNNSKYVTLDYYDLNKYYNSLENVNKCINKSVKDSTEKYSKENKRRVFYNGVEQDDETFAKDIDKLVKTVKKFGNLCDTTLSSILDMSGDTCNKILNEIFDTENIDYTQEEQDLPKPKREKINKQKWSPENWTMEKDRLVSKSPLNLFGDEELTKLSKLLKINQEQNYPTIIGKMISVYDFINSDNLNKLTRRELQDIIVYLRKDIGIKEAFRFEAMNKLGLINNIREWLND